MLRKIFTVLSVLWLTSCSTLHHHFTQSTSSSTVEGPDYWRGNSIVVWNKLKHGDSLPQSSDPISEGWVQLATIQKNNNDTQQLIPQLIQWRNQFPNHPANQLFPSDDSLNEILNTAPPHHYALLLPLQGDLSAQGQAIRDGFMNAYNQTFGSTANKPTVSFYDTNQNSNIGALYRQAISAGADFVIGPLTKDQVETVAHADSMTVPTLTLNYTDNPIQNAMVYQFGLSPLDEIQQVVDKARANGLSHAIIIAAKNPWGERTAKSLIQRFKAEGGRVNDVFYYSKNTNFPLEMATLFHANPPEPQHRTDEDVIFLLAQTEAARQVVSLLKNQYAQNVPIYATSSIYNGIASPEQDTELEGVNFVDIPYVFHDASTNALKRFVAIGHDAFLIGQQLPRLKKLPQFELQGDTGELHLTARQQIYRHLSWATMHNGHI